MTGSCEFVDASGGAPCGAPSERELDGRPLCSHHVDVVRAERAAKAARRDPTDPCPPDAPGVTDIGHGVRIRFTTYRGVTAGLVESHQHLVTGERCSSAVTFDLVDTVGLGYRPRWRVITRDPLTLQQSLRCRACGHDGFIRAGRWVPK